MQNLFSPLIKIYKALYLFAYNITGNYGISLILLSLFTFIVLYPFTKKAQQIQNKEHRIQSVLGPQIESIKKQYSGQEQYEQLQWLYRRYSYHPLYAIRSALGFIFQIPFLTTAYYMLSGLAEIQGVSWGMIQNLGSPDHLLHGVNVLPFVMTLVTVLYAFVMPGISKKERIQTIAIGVFFLILLYSAPAALLIFWTCNLIWSLLDSLLSEKLAWVGEYVAENELAFHVIFALALTVGLFVPTEIYIKNASQLWFGYNEILKFLIVDTLKYIGALILIYLLLCRIKLNFAFLKVLLGLLFGIFIQSYIIGLNYGIFDGHGIKWEEYTAAGFFNTSIWLSCFAIPFCLYYFVSTNKRENAKKIIKTITFLMVLVQCIVLSINLVKKPIQKGSIWDTEHKGVLTFKDIYSVSVKDNIIVFLLDMFDASIFEEIQNKNPEIIGSFQDFTYFPNTTSSYGCTDYSVPEILTGVFYDIRDRYPDYIKNAWQQTQYYKILKNNNYSIALYTNGNYIAKSAPVDNFLIEKVKLDDKTVDQFRDIRNFRIVPHYFKKIFYFYNPNIHNPSILTADIKPYFFDDRAFFIGAKKGLHITSKNNVFRFYHLNGMHYPFVLDENVEPISKEKGTAYRQAVGSLKIVGEYLRQMRNHKIYNNATLAVVADHGYQNIVGSRPILLIKQPNSKQDFLKINSKPMTVSALMPTLLSRFKLSDYKRNNNAASYQGQERYYYLQNENGFSQYKVFADARYEESWKQVGKIDLNSSNISTDQHYRIGDIIDFSNFGNSYKYKTFGWAPREAAFGSIIMGQEAELVLDLSRNDIKKEESLLLKIEGYADVEQKLNLKVCLYANDIQISDWNFDTTGKIYLASEIPEKLLREMRLRLSFFVDSPNDARENLSIANIQIILLKK